MLNLPGAGRSRKPFDGSGIWVADAASDRVYKFRVSDGLMTAFDVVNIPGARRSTATVSG